MKHFSVIIPAYNEESLIEKTLLSVKEQDYPNLEMIVVDNDSNDSTSEIAKDYADLVLTYGMEHNVCAVRNFGAKNSNGEYIAFIDADSCLSSNAISNAAKYLDEQYAGGTCKLIPPEDKLIAKLQTGILNNWARFIAPQYTPFIYTTKENFDEVGGWNENLELGNELDFQRNLSKLGKLKFDLESYITTSPRRYQEEGYMKTSFLGVLGYFGFKIKWRNIRK
ncbi:MAG: glycosyltransferase [Candidatus Woesearchaeota archaeon]